MKIYTPFIQQAMQAFFGKVITQIISYHLLFRISLQLHLVALIRVLARVCQVHYIYSQRVLIWFNRFIHCKLKNYSWTTLLLQLQFAYSFQYCDLSFTMIYVLLQALVSQHRYVIFCIL